MRAAARGAGQIYGGVLAQTAFVIAPLSALGALGQFTATAGFGVALNLVWLPLLALAPLLASLYYPALAARAVGPDGFAPSQPVFDVWARGCFAVAAAVTAFFLVWPEGPVIVVATEKYLHATLELRLLSPLVAALVCDVLITNTLWGVQAAGAALRVAAVRLALLGLLFTGAVLLTREDGPLAAAVSGAMALAGLAGALMHVVALRAATGWRLPWRAALRAGTGAGAVVALGRMAAGAAGAEDGPLLALAVAGTAALALCTSLALLGLTADVRRGWAAARAGTE
jgi:hypothetical protein